MSGLWLFLGKFLSTISNTPQGLYPTEITMNNPELLKRLDIAEGTRRLTNFRIASNLEITNYARIVRKIESEMREKKIL